LRQSWRHLAVLEGESTGGFPKTRFARSGARALRPPQMVCLKWQDQAVGSNQSLRSRVAIQHLRMNGLQLRRAGALRDEHSPERGFKSAHQSRYAVNARRTSHAQYGPSGWLGPYLFLHSFICNAGLRTLSAGLSRALGSPTPALALAAAADRELPRSAWDPAASNLIAPLEMQCDRTRPPHSLARAARHIL
jgi:hypothetical protein